MTIPIRQNLFTAFNTFLASRMPMFSRCFQVLQHLGNQCSRFKPKAGISRKLLPTLRKGDPWGSVLSHWASDVWRGSFFLTPCLGAFDNQEGWCVFAPGLQVTDEMRYTYRVDYNLCYVVANSLQNKNLYRICSTAGNSRWPYKRCGVKSQGCESQGWLKILQDFGI